MIKKLLIIFIILTFSASTYAEAGKYFYATVVRVIDGDSFILDAGGSTMEIRLYGVDAPEYNQPFSKEAKKFTRQWLGKQQVKVEPFYTDSYGRSVAMVVQDGRTLNSDLVQAGLAWVHPRYCLMDICKSWKTLEGVARTGQFGLWQDVQAISPWQWKKLLRRKQ